MDNRFDWKVNHSIAAVWLWKQFSLASTSSFLDLQTHTATLKNNRTLSPRAVVGCVYLQSCCCLFKLPWIISSSGHRSIFKRAQHQSHFLTRLPIFLDWHQNKCKLIFYCCTLECNVPTGCITTSLGNISAQDSRHAPMHRKTAAKICGTKHHNNYIAGLSPWVKQKSPNITEVQG